MKLTMVCHKYGVPLDDPCSYPLGYLYVAAHYKNLGHEVKMLNYNLYDYDLKEEIKGQDFVLFTGFEEFYDQIVRDAAICREAGVKVILGGALATFCSGIMKPHVDMICIGEVERATPIDKIPFPDYDLFGIDEYHRRNNLKHIGILTSRGCPFMCTFCSQTCSYRLRNLQNVEEELKLYKQKYRPDVIVFNDNTLNISETRFLAICDIMRKLKTQWSASIRCDTFTKAMAESAKNSGCIFFVVGVESFQQHRLDKMKKRIKVEDIKQTLDILHSTDINYHGNVLVGFEGETYADIIQELESIPAWYNVFPMLVQPFVGTKHGVNRSITEVEERYLSDLFGIFAEAHGKYTYPH